MSFLELLAIAVDVAVLLVLMGTAACLLWVAVHAIRTYFEKEK